MKKGVAFVGLFILITGITILLLGCAPGVIMVRPPEPRIEVYGAPPHSGAVWISGYWKHKRGEWIWVPGHWASPPKPHGVWVSGHWEPRGRGWLWIPGHWEYR